MIQKETLQEIAKRAGIEVDKLQSAIASDKEESIELMASTGKPILLATGASNIEEVREAVSLIEKYNAPYVLMQCNTNYTGEFDNFKFLNLNVIASFKEEFPKAVLGLSDHSQGHVGVLGAIALGARAI
jgi:N-acetylneuraminate synthase